LNGAFFTVTVVSESSCDVVFFERKPRRLLSRHSTPTVKMLQGPGTRERYLIARYDGGIGWGDYTGCKKSRGRAGRD
jgi:hypothetical protein